jgi:uncharacterized membrane protein
MEDCCANGFSWLFKGLAVLLVFIGLAVFVSAVLYTLMNPGSIPFGSWNFSSGWIWNIVGLLIFIWFLSWLLRLPFRGHRHWRYYDDEKGIARRRYADGEITRKQYLEIVKDLENTRD